MNVGKLRQVLMDVGAIFSAAGASKQVADLERIAALMKGRENQPVNQFLDELQTDLAPLSTAAIIAAHVASLLKAGTDELAFRTAYDSVTRDAAVKKSEADHIAHGYIGGREKWPNKKAAIEAIEKEFVARRYDASKMKEVARSRPW